MSVNLKRITFCLTAGAAIHIVIGNFLRQEIDQHPAFRRQKTVRVVEDP